MGSLMAGWNSHITDTDPKAVKLTRNKSVTKDGIEAFWKAKKLEEDISLLSPRTQKIIFEEAVERCEGSSETNLEKIIQKNGWWISSNWAFLNEPPVLVSLEGTGQKYASQFHVASVAGSSTAHAPTGISP